MPFRSATCKVKYRKSKVLFFYFETASRDLKSGCGGMVDTLASGASGGNPVKVQVLSSAPKLMLFNARRKELSPDKGGSSFAIYEHV